MRIPASDRRIGRLASLLVAVAATLRCSPLAAPSRTRHPTGDVGRRPASSPARSSRSRASQAAGLYWAIFLIAVVIFVLVEGLLLYMALPLPPPGQRGRAAGPDPRQQPPRVRLDGHPGPHRAAMFIVSMNVLNTVAGQVGRAGRHGRRDRRSSGSGRSTYPDSGLTFTGAGQEGPEMVVPVDEPVLVRLNAADVIHSFYVPAFFTKLDVVPGRTNEFEFTVEQPGTYGGQCAEFCGLPTPTCTSRSEPSSGPTTTPGSRRRSRPRTPRRAALHRSPPPSGPRRQVRHRPASAGRR